MKIRFVAALLPFITVFLCGGVALGQPCDAAPCKDHGFCTRNKGGNCGAATDADCKGSAACKSNGFCKHHEGRCIQGSDGDCARSDYCKPYGLCSYSNHECVAKSDNDCKKSSGCKTLGLCSAENGVCVVSNKDDCKALDGCKVFGKCTSKGHGCIVGSDADCFASSGCKEGKACKKGVRLWGHFVVTKIKPLNLSEGTKFASIGDNIPQAAPSLVAGEDVECMKVFRTVDYESPKDRTAGKEKAETCCKEARKTQKTITCGEIPNGGRHTSEGIAVKKKCMEQAGFTKGKIEEFAVCRIKTSRCVVPAGVETKAAEKGAEKGAEKQGAEKGAEKGAKKGK